MFKKLWEDVTEWIQEQDKKTLLFGALIFVVASLFLGTLIRFIIDNLSAAVAGESWHFNWHWLVEALTWTIGLAIVILLGVVYALNGGFRSSNKTNKMLKGKGGEKDRIEGSLENSRFLTDEERDKLFKVSRRR